MNSQPRNGKPRLAGCGCCASLAVSNGATATPGHSGMVADLRRVEPSRDERPVGRTPSSMLERHREQPRDLLHPQWREVTTLPHLGRSSRGLPHQLASSITWKTPHVAPMRRLTQCRAMLPVRCRPARARAQWGGPRSHKRCRTSRRGGSSMTRKDPEGKSLASRQCSDDRALALRNS